MADPDPYGQGIQLASLTDAPNAGALAQALGGLAGMVPRTIMRFASASARAAALTGATAPAAGMGTWLIAEKRLDVYDGTAWVPQVPDLVTSTSGATAASGFSLVSFSGYKDGRTTLINFSSTKTGSAPGANILADGNGNIADTDIGTLPSGWRPPETIYAAVGDGFGAGECSITSGGLITIRAWSTNSTGSNSNGGIIVGRNLRVTSTFIQP